jgi:hypothetical protein
MYKIETPPFYAGWATIIAHGIHQEQAAGILREQGARPLAQVGPSATGGTMSQTPLIHFFQKVASNAELRAELVELAVRHGIDFSDELSDGDLRGISGGVAKLDTMGDMGSNTDLQNAVINQQQALQAISNASQALYNTALATVKKIGG